MHSYTQSVAQELSIIRNHLRLGQIQLARLLNIKLHRLSDLEKGRSWPTPVEESRIRRQLKQLMADTEPEPDLLAPFW